MMDFRVVKDKIISILEAQSNGAFQTKKSQKQSTGATENEIIPRVTVYYDSGQFPKSSGSYGSDRIHLPVYKVEVQVIAPHKVDLAIMNNDAATIGQKAAALADMINASDNADLIIDEAFENVYQIIMSAINIDLDLPVGTVTDIWIESIKKDQPNTQGEFIILTGSFEITCRVNETVPGEIGTSGTDFDNSMNIKDDPNDNFGTSGNLGG